MLKSVSFLILVAFTGLRLVDVMYLITRDSVNLPVTVIVVIAAMVLYGVALITKQLLAKTTVKELITFYVSQAAAIVFNLVFVSIACPIKLSIAEMLAVGTFLDLVVIACVLYYGMKQLRVSARVPMHIAAREI